MKFWISYSDGQYFAMPLEGKAAPEGCATIDLEGEDLARWERHNKEAQYWYERLKAADNAFFDWSTK